MREFHRVGAAVAFGQVEVSLAEFREVHDLAARDLWQVAGSYESRFDSYSDLLRYAFYFKGEDRYDLETHDRFVAVQLSHESEPDSCRLSVSLRTFKDSARHSNKLIRYSFDVLNGEVLEAKKAVYLVLGASVIDFDAHNEPVEIVRTDRKMYERPLRSGEPRKVAALLGSTLKRAGALAA